MKGRRFRIKERDAAARLRNYIIRAVITETRDSTIYSLESSLANYPFADKICLFILSIITRFTI